MATWVTHLMVADMVMNRVSGLDRRGFCVGNITPDCNIENEDWSGFTPPREVTHWMSGAVKVDSDGDDFCREYLIKRADEIKSNEHKSFLMGYYCHLITDAAFQKMIRDEKRVRDIWVRIKDDDNLRERGVGLDETWDNVKMIMSKKERLQEIYTIEAEYIRDNPNSGYITEILPLKSFPDYLDYMPKGGIIRKIGVMGYLPKNYKELSKLISISYEEHTSFVQNTAELAIQKFNAFKLI